MNASSLRRPAPTSVGLALGAATISLAVGAGLGHGSSIGYALVGSVVMAALVLLISELGWLSIAWWAVVTAAAYPFLRVPSDGAVVTFDRVWTAGMLARIVAVPRVVARSRATTVFIMALSWLAASYLIRSAVASAYQPSNLRVSLDALILPLILFAATNKELVTPRRCHVVAGAIAITGAALALLGLGERVFGYELASLTGGVQRFDENIQLTRISGPYPGPETYSLSLVLCLAATLYWMQAVRGAAWVAGSAIVALEATAIGLTFFRAAWIAALVVVIAAFGIRRRRYTRLFAVTGVVLAVLAVALGELESDAFSNRINNVYNANSRLASWQEAIGLFQGHPLFGVGVNQFPDAVASKPLLTVRGAEAAPQAHSSYFGQLAEQGLWGLLPLVAATIAAGYLVQSLNQRSCSLDDALLVACVGGAAVGYLLMSLTLTMLPYSPSNLLLALLLGMVAARIDAREDAVRRWSTA